MRNPWDEQIPGMTMPFPTALPSTGAGASTVGSVATGAISKGGSGGALDQMMQRIMTEVFGKPDMSGAVQNRPQVMLPQPIRPKQIPMGEPNQIHATTASGQRRNDLSSLISSVGNIVKAGVNKKREKEDRDLMADLAVISAASSQPDDPHNKAILDAIASDSKRTKRLEKALGYNPLSGEPPPPEAQTLSKFAQQNQQKQQQKTEQITQAIAQKLGPQAAQQGGVAEGAPVPQPIPNAIPGQNQPMPIPNAQPGQTRPQPIPNAPGGAMQALISRSPNVAQLSPMVQMQAQLIKAGILPKADTSLQSMTSLFKEMMVSDTKFAEIYAKLQEKNAELANKLLEIRERGRQVMEQEKLKQTGAGERAKTRAGAQVESAKIRAQSAKETAKIRQETVGRIGELRRQHSLLVKEVSAIDQDIKNLDVQIASAKEPRKSQLIQEQQMKKELKTAKEQLMDTYDKQTGQLNETLRQSPTSQLDIGDDNKDIEQQMDEEDRIF